MESVKAIVMNLEQELLDPTVRTDVHRLDTLIAEDFLEVGATGRSFGKAEVLGRLPAEIGISFRASSMQAHVLSEDVVLVTYAAVRDLQGQAGRSLRSSVWVKNAGGWQMRYHQGTAAA